MKTTDVSSAPPTTPLFGLTLEAFEPVFKNWVKEVLNAASTEQVSDTEPKFYTRDELKRILHISLPTIDRYAKLGIINGSRVGNRILFPKDSIQEAMKTMKSEKFRR
jgi:hypothetical protein